MRHILLILACLLVLARPAHAVWTDWQTCAAQGSTWGASTATVGLQGWWRTAEAISGTCPGAITDSSGVGNTTTCVGTPTYTAGHIGTGALTLNGSSQYVNAGNNSAVQITGSITVSAWVKLAVLPVLARYEAVVMKGYDGTNTGFQLDFQDDTSTGNTPALLFASYSATTGAHGAQYSLAGHIVVNQWYLITGTYDGTTWRLWVNGVDVADSTDAHGPQATAKSLFIGAGDVAGTPSFFFQGSISDVRIYNRALSASEILNLGATPSPIVAGNISAATIARYNDQYPTKYNYGDTYNPTWADNDNLYSPTDDTTGWNNDDSSSSNLIISQLTGTTTITSGATVNPMSWFGGGSTFGPDGATWKADGLVSIGGTLYLWVSRHTYGCNQNPLAYCQPTADSSILKSTDHGLNWTNASGATNTAPVLGQAMFPGPLFSAPYFFQHGQDGAVSGNINNAGTYVYAISPSGSDFGASQLLLGRVLRSRIANLNASDWQFYTGGDGMQDANWGLLASAVPVLAKASTLAMAGPVYNAALRTYILPEWDWIGGNIHNSQWDFYQSPTPWGPWTIFYTYLWPYPAVNGYRDANGNSLNGAYSPAINPKSFSTDGKSMSILTSGDWTHTDIPTGQYCLYQMTMNLSTTP